MMYVHSTYLLPYTNNFIFKSSNAQSVKTEAWAEVLGECIVRQCLPTGGAVVRLPLADELLHLSCEDKV